MFKNYLITAYRNLVSNMAITSINLFGLITSLAISIMIFLFVSNELDVDKFDDAALKYRLELQQKSDQSPKWAITHKTWSENYADKLQELEYFFVVEQYKDNAILKINDKSIFDANMYYSTSKIIEFLQLNVIERSEENPLSGVNKAIISTKSIEKYFGDSNAIGKVLSIEGDDFIITGTFKQKIRSHITPDIIVTYDKKIHKDNWNYTYLKLMPNIDPKGLEEKNNNLASELSQPFY